MSIKITERYGTAFHDLFCYKVTHDPINESLQRSIEVLDFLSSEEKETLFALNKVKDTPDPTELSSIKSGATRPYTLANSDADCPAGTKCVKGVCVPVDGSEWEGFWASL